MLNSVTLNHIFLYFKDFTYMVLPPKPYLVYLVCSSTAESSSDHLHCVQFMLFRDISWRFFLNRGIILFFNRVLCNRGRSCMFCTFQVLYCLRKYDLREVTCFVVENTLSPKQSKNS